MKITIDSDIIKKKDISKDVFFHLLCQYFNIDMSDAPDKEANKVGLSIRDVGNKYIISIVGTRLVEQIVAESSLTSGKSDEYYEDIAKAMLAEYPAGIKPGTYKQWGGSVPQIADRLKFLEYYSGVLVNKEDAVNATKEYVDFFKDDNKYMQTLPYFIFKYKRNDGEAPEWYSNLLSIVENRKGTSCSP